MSKITYNIFENTTKINIGGFKMFPKDIRFMLYRKMGMNALTPMAMTNKSMFNEITNWFMKEYLAKILKRMKGVSRVIIKRSNVKCIGCCEIVGSLFPIVYRQKFPPSGMVNMSKISDSYIIEFNDEETVLNYSGITPHRSLDVSSNGGVHMYSYGIFPEYENYSCLKCIFDKDPFQFKE